MQQRECMGNMGSMDPFVGICDAGMNTVCVSVSLALCCSLGSYITGTTLDVEGGEEVLSATSQRQEDGRM
jgi:hypothetical protein